MANLLEFIFRQDKVNDKDGKTFHDARSIANTLGPEICQILPCFHTLTGSDYTPAQKLKF